MLGTHSHGWHRNGYYFHAEGTKLKLRDMKELWVAEPCESDSKASALNHSTCKPWPQMATGHLKYGESQLRCAVSVKDTRLQRLYQKKK